HDLPVPVARSCCVDDHRLLGGESHPANGSSCNADGAKLTQIRQRGLGRLPTRFPVAPNTAFAIAGAVHGTPGSPIPPDFSLLSTIWVSISGHSFIRITGKVWKFVCCKRPFSNVSS